ncbi:MAG: hypothetical protein LUI09_05860 [Prevotellaceae bacterium]|nr:hypothetical protein [Prevotellaceae bacterium]
METNKNMNEQSEYTELDTQVSGTQPTNGKQQEQPTQDKGKSKGMWQRAAVGAGVGAAIGAAATVVTSQVMASDDVEHVGEGETVIGTNVDIPVATGVNDSMSFTEAFNEARQEVGPGGVFEWHGNLYNTYTSDEWNSMSHDEQAEWGSHFSDNPGDYSHHDNYATHHETHINDSVSHTEPTATSGDETASVSQVDVQTADNTDNGIEVEVLGVVHDADTGANIGEAIIDGQDVLFVDADNDHTFDLMATDLNSDNQITQNEIIDISGQGLTVEDLGGFSDPINNPIIADNEIDYTNDDGSFNV